VRCVFHGNGQEKTPSLTLYADNFRCFGCNEQGDLVDWFTKAKGMTHQDAVTEALREAGIHLDPLSAAAAPTGRQAPPVTRPPVAAQGKPPAPGKAKIAGWGGRLVEAAHKALLTVDDSLSANAIPYVIRDGQTAYLDTRSLAGDATSYLEARGLLGLALPFKLGIVSDAVAAELDPGEREKYRDRLIIPFLDDAGRVLYLKARALVGQEPKYTQPAGEIPGPWNVAAIERARQNGPRFVVLAEGEIDALSILAACGADFPAVGLPGGNLKAEWAELLKGLTVYVLMDDDAAGHKHRGSILDTLAGLGIRARALEWTGDDVNAFLVANGPEALADRIAALIDEAGHKAVSDLAYVRDEFMEELTARATRKNTVYPTGLAAFDALLSGDPDDPTGGGFVAGLHIVAGVPGVGKTAWLLQVATHNAAAGRPVLLVSYEQPKAELWARIAGALTGIPLKAFKTGQYFYRDSRGGPAQMPTAEYMRLNRGAALEQLHAMAKCLRIVEGNAESGRWTVSAIKREAAALAEAYGEAPLVMVDYLQQAAPDPEHAKKDLRERIGHVSYGLVTGVVRDLQAPVVLVSSLGRNFYEIKGSETPESMLSGFKETGDIEYSAYTATLLYGLGDHEAVQNGLADTGFSAQTFRPVGLWCIKNREGAPGKALARFYPARGEYRDAGHAKEIRPNGAKASERKPSTGTKPGVAGRDD